MTAARSLTAALALAFPLTALAGSVTATFDPATGNYRVSDFTTGWTLSGTIGTAAKLRTNDGHDATGDFHELHFDWKTDVLLSGTIRTYDENSTVFFRLEYPQGKPGKSVAFPNFTNIPSGLKGFSYRDAAFSPGSFELNQTSTPWMLFDRRARSLVLSPASTFLIAKMVGDEKRIGVALNDRLLTVPKGLKQDSLLVFGSGIGQTWENWGASLRSLYNRVPAKLDVITQTYGYWTDNGADYYYKFDPTKGYTGTLLDLNQKYKAAGTPLGYMQLDSWWYRKLIDNIAGEKNPERKNPDLPESDWNRYGGILEYRATADLFPNGLNAFRNDLGLPFIVHGRWIDEKSPLREKYTISGVGPVDPRYWDDVANYLSSNGVISYEQDWMSNIYESSPEMSSVAGVADQFADGMANSMRRKGLSMQYCMVTPRFLLNGVRYPNLATVRPTTDRFEPRRWAQFMFGTPFVEAIGALPWCDVFRSRETGNMIVALLSAGPVGTGDAMGVEDRPNIQKAARPDGFLVKPDRPIRPTDRTYLNEAKKSGDPFIGTTYTDHAGLRTQYLFVFPRSLERTTPVNLGPAYVYDLNSGEGKRVDGGFKIIITGENYAYWMAAPITKTGVALLGDLGKFVPTGKMRIPSVVDGDDGLRVTVAFAKDEAPVTIQGYSERQPKLSAIRGDVVSQRYDAVSKRWQATVKPGNGNVSELLIDGR